MLRPEPDDNRVDLALSASAAIGLLIFFVTLVPVHAAEMPGCACSRDEIIATIKSANTIFVGRIVKASMDSRDDVSIRIWVDTMQSIRGAHDDAGPIVTSRPQQCGVPARIGAHTLFVVPANRKTITRCTGSGLPWGDEWRDLTLALITTEFWASDPGTVRKWLNRISPSSSLDEMRDYFNLIDEIDDYANVEYSGAIVRYRGMAFDFSGPKFRVSWRPD
jgi:hypothetical protein